MHISTLQDILYARKRIQPYLARTPQYTYSALNNLLGTELYVKHENYQPVGAFKVRGGVNLIAQLGEEERGRGVIAASTGNHGQSVAYAARLFGISARVVVPVGANPGKVAAMRGMGCEVIEHGANYDEAKAYCEQLAQTHGYRYIHSGNEPDLIAGVSTYVLEMLEDEPGLDVIIVPIGGGSGAAGACLVAHMLAPHIRVIGVQSSASPAAHESWQQKQLVTAPNRTIAEGLATGQAFELPQRILQEHLREFVLVSDREIERAMLWMIEYTHSLTEAAGASALAAAYQLRAELAHKKVGIICTGGNTSLEHLRQALNRQESQESEETEKTIS